MGTNNKEKDEANEGFVQKLLGGIFASTDPAVRKKRALRAVAKLIGKSRYKFFKVSANQALPAMGKYFYDIYKAIAPAQAILSNQQTSAALKTFIIDYSLSDKQKEAVERLEESSILERSKSLSVKDITKQVKDDFAIITNGFEANRITAIDSLYSLFLVFSSFISFDYFFLLKKFDSGMIERDFDRTPLFQPIRINFITDDLKDFIAVAWILRQKADWASVFSCIKAYKSVDPIAMGVWNKVLARINDLRLSRILELIIGYISGEPDYEPVIKESTTRIVNLYLERIRIQMEAVLNKITRDKADSKIDELVNSIFYTTDIQKLKNYTLQANEYFEKRALPKYMYCQPLNYMKAFLLDYYKKDVREVADLILVRGKWLDPAKSQQMSGAYYALLTISDQISALDDSLGENVERGSKIKTLSTRAERDKEAVRMLETSFKNVNGEAHILLNRGSQNLVLFAKFLKNLIDDIDKTSAEYLINWKELERTAETPIKKMFADVYKKIYLFISLMQVFLAEDKAI